MRHSWRDVLSALVALSLAVPTCAAPVDGEAAAARKEDLEFLYQTLERARPDLFANTPEERFLERKAAIETGLEEADDFTFALELQSLTALAGDSHTTLALGGSMSQTVHYYPMSLLHRDGSWYLSAVPAEHRALLGREITAVNGRSMEEIVEAFAAQVERDLSAGEYRRVVVDLRNNGGGSDGVIWPLLSVLRQEMDDGTEVVGLIGEATFSSAIINAVELQEMGIPLVGEPASGSVDHFGSVSGFSLPNSGIQIGVSSKYIDLGTLLDADAGRGVESLEPDIAVPQTMADTLAGRDTAVEWLLAHPETLEQREYPDAPLTRGRFVGLLYAAAGSPAAAAEAGFQDLLGIEWFLPAVNWAAETGVTGGTAEGAFAAARHLTWQEAAVFLVRTVEALGLEPEAVRTAPLPDALAEGAWDQTALELAWEWGLLPEDAGSAAEIARVQGGAMADAFAALL